MIVQGFIINVCEPVSDIGLDISTISDQSLSKQLNQLFYYKRM